MKPPHISLSSLFYGPVLPRTSRLSRALTGTLLLSGVVLAGCATTPKASKIQVAANTGQLDQVRQEVQKKGGSVNLNTGNYGTALHQAAMGRHHAVAQWLLDQGADVNAQTQVARTTPLYEASLRGDEPMVALLLQHKANPNLTNVSGMTPLHINLMGTGAVDRVTELLLQSGANPNIKNEDGWAPIHLAAERGALDSVRLFLAAGAPVDARSDTGATPLLQAAMFGRTNVVSLLLNRNASLERRNVTGETALFAAAVNGHEAVLRSLISARARLDAANDNQVTPLAAAIINEQFKAAAILIEAGAALPGVPEDATAEARFYSALHQKLLADHQQTLGQAAAAHTNYQAALKSLTTVREEFTKTAKANTSKAARQEFWSGVLAGMAQGMAAGLASYGSYQSYRTSAQMSALRHSSSQQQYFINVSKIPSYNQYLSQQPAIINPALNGQPPGRSTGAFNLRASAATLRHRAQVCGQFIEAIQSKLTQ